MQRARLVFYGAIYIWRGLPQLSSRISARLSKRREAMAMGSDQMADLDSIEARINERSASSAAADDLLHPDAPAKFATQSDELSPSYQQAACHAIAPATAGSGGCVSCVLAVAVSLCDAPRRNPFSSPRVFLAIRSMSAIGIICHWSLAPSAATRFPSSIIIAVIVLSHRGQFRRGALVRNTCSK